MYRPSEPNSIRTRGPFQPPTLAGLEKYRQLQLRLRELITSNITEISDLRGIITQLYERKEEHKAEADKLRREVTILQKRIDGALDVVMDVILCAEPLGKVELDGCASMDLPYPPSTNRDRERMSFVSAASSSSVAAVAPLEVFDNDDSDLIIDHQLRKWRLGPYSQSINENNSLSSDAVTVSTSPHDATTSSIRIEPILHRINSNDFPDVSSSICHDSDDDDFVSIISSDFDETRSTEDPSPEEMRVKFESILDPKSPCNKKSVGLPLKSIYKRIETIGFDLSKIDGDPGFLMRSFSTRRIRHVHGAISDDGFCIGDQGTVENYDKANYICLNPTVWPHAPQILGAPGLILSITLQPENFVQNVMVGVGEDTWIYRGKYTLTRTASLTIPEWDDLDSEVNRGIVRAVCFWNGAKDIRARVALRRELDRAPTAEEIEEKIKSIEHRPFKRGEKLTVAEIVADYGEGKEIVYVWAMKCVGYDETFQRSLIPS